MYFPDISLRVLQVLMFGIRKKTFKSNTVVNSVFCLPEEKKRKKLLWKRKKVVSLQPLSPEEWSSEKETLGRERENVETAEIGR